MIDGIKKFFIMSFVFSVVYFSWAKSRSMVEFTGVLFHETAGNMPAAPRSEPIVKRMRPESAVCLSISNFRDPFFFGPMVDLTIANNNLDGNHSIAAVRSLYRLVKFSFDLRLDTPVFLPWVLVHSC